MAQTSARVRRNRTILISVLLVVAAGVALVAGLFVGGGGPFANASGAGATPTPTEEPRPAPEAVAPPASVDTFDRAKFSIDDPNSIWVVVNKLRPLNPPDHVPPDLVFVDVPYTFEPELRQEAADAVIAMFNAASAEAGLSLASNSAYRSFAAQENIYVGDDLSTARPGFSEHQTGLSIDIGAESGECSIEQCFGDLPEGVWLRDNAWRFGFVMRYPPDKTPVTGYEWEPWHFRYVGTELAAEMRETGVITLEEFFGLPPAPNYE
jgi:D-alanyl-D-alanine carboxypeptidase